MTPARVALDGLDNLEHRLGDTRDLLEDLTPANREAAKVAAAQADPYVPRGATGKLSASSGVDVTAGGWALTNSAPYAVYVHWGTRHMAGRPWLITAARDSEDRWTEVYRSALQETLDGR